MKYKIFIDGEAGTTGLEIKERLSGMAELDLLSIESHNRKDGSARLSLYDEADIVFLCLPDEESKAIAAAASPYTKIIDASTAHRTDKDWVYGLPELTHGQRESIRTSNRIANPGCHATGCILLIKPIIDEGILHVNAVLSVHSLTGYSGGGRSMIRQYEGLDYEEDNHLRSPGQYALSQEHKHLPEMLRFGGMNHKPIFTPIVCDFYRGMLVSIPIHTSMLSKKMCPNEMRGLYADRYRDDPLIKVRAGDDIARNGTVYANGLAGRDDLEIIITGNDERMTLMARYDNLGKGASGTAIQNMNIMLGLPEYSGLRHYGIERHEEKDNENRFY